MTDPVAEAAAQLAATPNLIDEIKEGIHTLEEKVEHFIHPDAPTVTQAGDAGTADLPNAVPTPPAGAATDAAGDSPNVAIAAADQPATQPSVPDASTLTGTVGTAVSSASAIRMHLAAIRHHLNIRGFEQSAVADIHRELDAIEGWL